MRADGAAARHREVRMTLKRMFDVSASLVGLIVLSPLFAVLAVLIRLHDGGPVFFRQMRVGRGGYPFAMWKFRTMVVNAEALGNPLTVGRDPRITPVGHWLRKLKLDELPQLINVLRGEMSLVGPRPEVPKYVVMYTPNERRVLDLTPGITDPSSILYRDESELLALADDPERTYVEIVMPDKIRINLEYAEGASAWSDVVVVLKTLMKLMPAREAELPAALAARRTMHASLQTGGASTAAPSVPAEEVADQPTMPQPAPSRRAA